MVDFNLFIQALLPVALALMMCVLGLNVSVSDFRDVKQNPKAFFIGVSLQLLLLPVLAWVVILFANSFTHVPALLSIGLILLALCPGGATSNVISQLSGGNAALSISITAVNSLITPLILPLSFAFQVSWLQQDIKAFDIPLLSTTAKLLVISIVPVLLGMVVSKFAKTFTKKHKTAAEGFSTWLFLTVVCLLIINNLTRLVEVGVLMAIMCLSLCILAMLVTVFIANKANLDRHKIKTLQVEVGIQNAAMGIFVATELLNWSELALIPLCYGVLMNIPALYLIFSRKFSNKYAQSFS